jgi:hypothetical protein
MPAPSQLLDHPHYPYQDHHGADDDHDHGGVTGCERIRQQLKDGIPEDAERNATGQEGQERLRGREHLYATAERQTVCHTWVLLS